MDKKLEKAGKTALDSKAPPKYMDMPQKSLTKKAGQERDGESQDVKEDGLSIGARNMHGVWDNKEVRPGKRPRLSEAHTEGQAIHPGTEVFMNRIGPSGIASLDTASKKIEKRAEVRISRERDNDNAGEDNQSQKPMYREHRFLYKKEDKAFERKTDVKAGDIEGDTEVSPGNDTGEDVQEGNTAGRKKKAPKISGKEENVQSGKPGLNKEDITKEPGYPAAPKNKPLDTASRKIGKDRQDGNAGGRDDGPSFKRDKDNRKTGSPFFRKIEKAQNSFDVIEHELTANYDAEERKRSAAKDYIVGKAKGRAQERALIVAKKFAGKTSLVVKRAAIQLVKWLAYLLTAILPILILLIAAFSLAIVIFSGLIHEEQNQDAGGGYFGKMYYWIEYETGKADDSAFATVLGDGGRAFGIQFDYMYALQPFLRYCYGQNPIAYAPFRPFLEADRSALLGSQALASAWLQVFEENKEDFIENQKQFARMNYYDGIEGRAEQFGLKLKTRDEVCKGAVLSYSFQCGSSSAYDAVALLADEDDDEAFLKKIYEIRTARYPAFSSRYEREYSTALALLKGQGSGEFMCPVDMSGCMVTSEFGEYRSPSDPAHKGTDFGSYGGANVPTYSIAEGTVLIAGYSPSAGNWVVIDHGNGIVAKYMHHESIRVAVGQAVRKGEQIGNMGTTGYSTGVHLHLQIEVDGVAVNARNYINF